MPLNRNKVVIIGDDAVSLYMVRELLVDEHLEVVTLRKGPGTLGLVRSIRPDLILLGRSDQGNPQAGRGNTDNTAYSLLFCRRGRSPEARAAVPDNGEHRQGRCTPTR